MLRNSNPVLCTLVWLESAAALSTSWCIQTPHFEARSDWLTVDVLFTPVVSVIRYHPLIRAKLLWDSPMLHVLLIEMTDDGSDLYEASWISWFWQFRFVCTMSFSLSLHIIVFRLIYNLTYRRMFTSKVWRDDGKLLQESNLTAY